MAAYRIGWTLSESAIVVAGWVIFGIGATGFVRNPRLTFVGRTALVTSFVLMMLPIHVSIPPIQVWIAPVAYQIRLTAWLAASLLLYGHLYRVLRAVEHGSGRRLILWSIAAVCACQIIGLLFKTAGARGPVTTAEVVFVAYVDEYCTTAGFACLGASVIAAWRAIRRQDPFKSP